MRVATANLLISNRDMTGDYPDELICITWMNGVPKPCSFDENVMGANAPVKENRRLKKMHAFEKCFPKRHFLNAFYLRKWNRLLKEKHS